MYKSPYEKYRDSEVWEIIQVAINNLISNNDLELTTHNDLVVGYLAKQIIENAVVIKPHETKMKKSTKKTIKDT